MFNGKWQRAVIRVWSYSLCIVNTCHKYLAILINRPSSSNKNENSLYFHRWKPRFSPRDQVSSCTFSQNLRDKSSCPQHPVLHNAIKDLRPRQMSLTHSFLIPWFWLVNYAMVLKEPSLIGTPFHISNKSRGDNALQMRRRLRAVNNLISV